MNRSEKRRWAWSLVAVSLFLCGQARLAGSDPYVVVTVAGADRLLNGVRWVLSSGGAPQMASLVDGFLQGLTQGKGLSGLDRTKPLGLYLSVRAAAEPDVVIFLPVADSKAFLEVLRPYFPAQSPTADGLTSLEGAGRKLLVKSSRGYSFFSTSPAPLKDAAVPTGSLRNQQEIGVDVNFSRLSKEVRARLFSDLRSRLGAAWMSLPQAQSDSEASGREWGSKAFLEAAEMMLKQGDRLSVGLSFQEASGRLELEWELLASPGTELAGILSKFGRASSSFSALSNQDAPLSLACAAPIAPNLRDQWVRAVKTVRNAEERQLEGGTLLQMTSKEPAGTDPFERLTRILAGMESLDLALVLSSGPAGKPQVLFAWKTGSAGELEKLVEELSVVARRPEGIEEIKLDVAKVGAARIHAVSVSGKLREAIGGGPVHIAVQGDQLFVATGGDTLSALKSALYLTSTPGVRLPPISWKVRPSKLVELFGGSSDPASKAAKDAFSGKGDFASFEVIPVDRGMKARLALGEGFLRFFVSRATGQPKAQGASRR
jgi:hypothetical protein